MAPVDRDYGGEAAGSAGLHGELAWDGPPRRSTRERTNTSFLAVELPEHHTRKPRQGQKRKRKVADENEDADEELATMQIEVSGPQSLVSRTRPWRVNEVIAILFAHSSPLTSLRLHSGRSSSLPSKRTCEYTESSHQYTYVRSCDELPCAVDSILGAKTNAAQPSSDKESPVPEFPMKEWSVKIYMLDQDGNEKPATAFNKVTYNLHPSFENPSQSELLYRRPRLRPN